MKLSIVTNRTENTLGYAYLLFYQFFLPSLISIAGGLMGYAISLSVLNIVFFLVNFLCVTAIFHRFLWQSLKKAWENRWRCLLFTAIGLILYFAAMFAIGQIIARIDPDFFNVNDNAIAGLTQEHTAIIVFCTIFLVPVVEETLFRGLIFQQLSRKSRLLAYCVCCTIFAAIHIIGYIGTESWLTLLLCFVQYLPAGITLAWAYEQADSIVAPILMHIAINQIGIAALR